MNNYPNYNRDEYMTPQRNQQNARIPAMNQDYNKNLVNTYDGFIRGNLFSDLFMPYSKNEPFNLTPQNEREALLNKYRELDFALIDLSLFLDVFPNDAEKIRLYNQILKNAEQVKKEYETRYGPLTLNGEGLNTYPWAWLNSPWPWEGE